MTKQYNLPTAELLSVFVSKDNVTIAITISRQEYLSYPIAPASLIEPNTRSFFPLHQLVKREGPRLVFETYKLDLPHPLAGAIYEFCSWWIPDAMDAVRDTSAKWERLIYPDNGCHDHCLLTWSTISAYEGHKEGYYNSLYGWITIEAYRDFIERDILRIRRNWRSIENSTKQGG